MSFESEFCKVEYLEDLNAIHCQWKQKCAFKDYREPLEYGLKLIHEKSAKVWITDTTHGFESEVEDTQWLLSTFIPQCIESSCDTIYFVIEEDSPLQEEITGQTQALSQYFNSKCIQSIEDIPFIEATSIVDYMHSAIQKLAKELSNGSKDDEAIAKNCFEYVRDVIHHSGDYQDQITTCTASEVLEHGTGWCYAKAILLAALLRANGIPTGFCYQRLSCGEYKEDIYCLHGLNAIYLKSYGWYRVDARGNKEGVDAQFSPPVEKLAFKLGENEYDLSEIYTEPLPEVLHALQTYKNYGEMIDNFPDYNEEK